MHIFVPIIILVIIGVQIFFFVKNLIRMNEFSKIFSRSDTWRLRWNPETNFVNGLFGSGNSIFESIKESINKYLGNNSGSVIDFGLLKDAIDRHCDSVENEIQTQTPIPLYWGLAGTMAGVILGLWELLDSNAIITLMSSGSGQVDANALLAAKGIDSLLSGVAWAMAASICGIILTTCNSILFKQCKLKEESGKNSFLAWMQSVLLPELPSDTSDALRNLVRNLNKFNKTFEQNTNNLGKTLKDVNKSYEMQADIIQAVHDMDVMKMAKANVRVLAELKECTDKLEIFNEYLSEVEGYTQAIHRFEKQFEDQANRIHVLEEIRDFFNRHKSEIAKSTADADDILQKSLGNLRDSTSSNINGLNAHFIEQSEHFKKMIEEEKEAFGNFTRQLHTQFSEQMSTMPKMARQLEEISAIPAQLDKLVEKIDQSNSKLVKEISSALKQRTQDSGIIVSGDDVNPLSEPSSSNWMKWVGLAAVIIIAIACVFNMVTYFIPKAENVAVAPVQTETVKEEVVSAETTPATPDTTNSNKMPQKVNTAPMESAKDPITGPII